MASKSEADAATVLTCRVCGGEVNARKECVVCGTKQTDAPSAAGAKDLAAWLRGDAPDNGPATWGGTTAPGEGPTDGREASLKRWLAGEDTALQDWIGTPSLGGTTSKTVRSEPADDDKLRELRTKALEADGLRAELEAMRSTLNRELSNFRNGKFDPIQYIEETASLSKQLQTEIAKRKELEQEIEHIKKGSIAVIKYVKGQQLKVGALPESKKLLDKEVDTRRRLEAELAELKAVNEALQDKIEVGLAKIKPHDRELKKRELELTQREAALAVRQTQVPIVAPSPDGVQGDEELKRRLEEELREKEQDYLAKEEELKKRIIGLEEAVNKYQIEDQVRAQQKALEGKPKKELEDILHRKEQEVLSKEKSMLLREQEIQRLQEQLQLREDEMRKLKEPLQYKEEEVLRREQDITYRENLLQQEMRKLEQLKAEGVSSEEKDLRVRLEDLKAEINQKEEEVRNKESYLKHKMEELRQREQGLVDEEIESREEDRKVEFQQQRVKTGIARLDDLLFGGIPYGSNISVYGPAYVGKEVVVNLFMAEGLKKGLPVLWVLTDKSPMDIRDEMKFVMGDDYDTYEKKGLVKYVDAYSKSMGADAADPNTTYIDDPTDHASILKAVDTIAAEFRKAREGGYRLAFRSVSTLIAYLDPTTTFKFLQPFVGRRKRDKAVAMFIIEKGMHEEQEIQMLGSLMDGSLEFKVEQLKSFLQVKGIADVQSRAWIRYTYTKNSVTIGSFSLDHIK